MSRNVLPILLYTVMKKYLFFFILCSFVFNAAFAQKSDTVVCYIKNSGKIVSTKDSADFFLVIFPPDTDVDKKLFIVKEFYPNGKIRLICSSRNNTLKHLKFQGPYIVYFLNGHKREKGMYEKGQPVGYIIEYYPDGRLYNRQTYTPDHNLLLNECRDSTGKVLAENGNGTWITFLGDSFNENYSEGQVKNGMKEGEWRAIIKNTVNFTWVFEKGKLLAAHPVESLEKIYTSVDTVPAFPGGKNAFSLFLAQHIHYRRNGTHGAVLVSFVVEKDGSLTNIKVDRGIGDGCDEEAFRTVSLSPRWKPGIQDGKPVRVAYELAGIF